MPDVVEAGAVAAVAVLLVLGLVRLHCQGMTRAQARAALQAGFTVTI